MSGLSEAAQKVYFRFWIRWMTFQQWRNKGPWLNPEKEGWDEDLLDWILYENKVAGICASTIQGSISALRNMHLISGKADFAKAGSRYKRLPNALHLEHTPKTKTPSPFELVAEITGWLTNPVRRNTLEESVVAIIAMFTFRLRGSEMANLRWNDIRFGRDGCERFVTIFISRSKTDQAGTGVYRSLTASGGKVCVVKTLLKWANINDWDPDSKEKVFGPNILEILGRTLERISAVKGLPTRLYTAH